MQGGLGAPVVPISNALVLGLRWDGSVFQAVNLSGVPQLGGRHSANQDEVSTSRRPT
jgi:hypothetical protein